MPFLNPYSNPKEEGLSAPCVTRENGGARAEQLPWPIQLSECERVRGTDGMKCQKPQNLVGLMKRKEGGREKHREAVSMSVSFKTRTRTFRALPDGMC